MHVVCVTPEEVCLRTRTVKNLPRKVLVELFEATKYFEIILHLVLTTQISFRTNLVPGASILPTRKYLLDS